MNQNPVLSSPLSTLVTYPFVAACCYIPLSQMIGAGMPYKRTLSQRCLSQARRFCYKPMPYVAEWPPKPVTNPMFLIHSQLSACGSKTLFRSFPLSRPLISTPPRSRAWAEPTKSSSTCREESCRRTNLLLQELSYGRTAQGRSQIQCF